MQIIGSRGVGVGQFNKPRSVAVDAQDNLYVVDMTGRVQKFSSNGVFLLSWQMPQTDLGKPKGMGRDRDGNIIVLEPHYQRVNVFSPEGKLVAQWGEHGTNAGEFTLPRAVAVNSRGEVFVSEYSGGRTRAAVYRARGDSCLAGFGQSGNAARRVQPPGRVMRGCAGPPLRGRLLQPPHPGLCPATASSSAPMARRARARAS